MQKQSCPDDCLGGLHITSYMHGLSVHTATGDGASVYLVETVPGFGSKAYCLKENLFLQLQNSYILIASLHFTLFARQLFSRRGPGDLISAHAAAT